MYAYLRGTLASITPPSLILDVQGVGYWLTAPSSLFPLLPPIGEECLVYTSLVIRENDHHLYAFFKSEDRLLFSELTQTSGIGPKLALALVGHLTPRELEGAVQQADTTSLCRVPGIGRRTAERLLIDLKNKLPTLTARAQAYGEPLDSHKSERLPHSRPILNDGISALINLGYTPSKAENALRQALEKEQPENLPELITLSLKYLS